MSLEPHSSPGREVPFHHHFTDGGKGAQRGHLPEVMGALSPPRRSPLLTSPFLTWWQLQPSRTSRSRPPQPLPSPICWVMLASSSGTGQGGHRLTGSGQGRLYPATRVIIPSFCFILFSKAAELSVQMKCVQSHLLSIMDTSRAALFEEEVRGPRPLPAWPPLPHDAS